MKSVALTRRTLLISALAGALSLGGAASSAMAQHGPGVTDKEIKIGAWIPLTGPIAIYGVPQRAGMDAYLGMINDRGGVNGRRITWIVENNEYNPQRTIAAARKLVERDNVLAIVHPNGTAQSAAAFPYILEEAKVPVLLPVAGLRDWWVPPRENLFGMLMYFENQAHALGRWAAKDGAKSVMVVHSALAAFEHVAKSVEPGVRSATPDAKFELYATKFDTADYAPVAIDIAKKKPDAVVFILAQPEIVRLTKEFAQQGFKAQMLSYSPTVANGFIELGGAAVEGVKGLSLNFPPNTDSAAMKEYRDALAKYAPSEKPDYQSLFAFATGKVFVEAIRRISGPITRPALVKSMESLRNFETGLSPAVTFGPDRRMGLSALQRVQVTKGQWVAVGTPIAGETNW